MQARQLNFLGSASDRIRFLALAGTLLAGSAGMAQAADGMVGGEFALKGQVTSTIGRTAQ